MKDIIVWKFAESILLLTLNAKQQIKIIVDVGFQGYLNDPVSST